MQFNSSLLVDFTKWNQVKMVREVPVKAEAGPEDPKFGAGSEFGKDMREEARRKKLGIVAKKIKPDSYPWLMRVGGKNGKKYRGVRGGSVTENASYYVFTQAKDGAFEASPVSEWYNFQHVQRYKALTAEEAEEQFTKRDKIMNYFTVMVKKRLKNDEDVDEDSEGLGANEKKKAGKKKKSGAAMFPAHFYRSEYGAMMRRDDFDGFHPAAGFRSNYRMFGDYGDYMGSDFDFYRPGGWGGYMGSYNDFDGDYLRGDYLHFKLTDMDEWPDSDEGDEDESGEEGDDDEDRKKKKKRDVKEKMKKKNRKSNVKDEAFEDSDDGDDEGREMDYISDSSESEDELKPVTEEKGVDQEDALKRLLDSDAEVEESSEEEKKSDEDEEKKKEEEDQQPEKKKKSKKKKKKKEVEKEEKSSDSDNADSSEDEKAAPKVKTEGSGAGPAAAAPPAPSKAEKILNDMKAADNGTLTGAKRPSPTGGRADGGGVKRKPDDAAAMVAKRAKLEPVPSPQVASDTGITEEAVRRYLTRRPMTTTELLQKFKSKKVGLSSDQLVPVIAQILKKINPNKQTIKGKMYLSINK
ncbi:General transcription factor IIF subunit 1 [Amphibalanus amphitrite]|uniref:Transcription initiation factor IIF subunit alpha n=1 Tax=Amphibalanus amphitrite TaxID=1232801 RepID=A0A6A4WJC9_AMPAM|nr:General transcription factor IIF subunit 1 [Amphibalanus amphitrite]